MIRRKAFNGLDAIETDERYARVLHDLLRIAAIRGWEGAFARWLD
jgi:hypothetical protein